MHNTYTHNIHVQLIAKHSSEDEQGKKKYVIYITCPNYDLYRVISI